MKKKGDARENGERKGRRHKGRGRERDDVESI